MLSPIIIKRQAETCGGDGYVHGIDCGDGFMGVYLRPNSSCMDSIRTALCMSIVPQ